MLLLKNRLIDEIDGLDWEDKHYERRKGDTPATKKSKALLFRSFKHCHIKLSQFNQSISFFSQMCKFT